MKRFLLLLVLILPALACNLGSTAAPTPTPLPASVLTTPTLGINPVVGPPGTVINVAAAGFPPGIRVNLFLSTVTTPSTIPLTTLTVGGGGVLTFAMQLPDRVNNQPISDNTPLVFTLTAESGSAGANALFLALNSTANSGGSVQPTGVGNSSGVGNASDLFITAPPIELMIGGGVVVVTGSGSAASGRVSVQLLDSNSNILGSAVASIQAAAGYIGPWEVTLTFNAPASQSAGFIRAFTAEGKQASIPIIYAGSGVVASPVPTQGLPGLFPTLAPTLLFQNQ